MKIIISPAKTLDFSTKAATDQYSIPVFIDRSEKLIKELKKYSPPKLEKLMKISPKLANLNYDRFQEWQLPFTQRNSKQALLAFRGEVYTGIDADTMSGEDIDFAQQHLRILSGLYGILCPLDLIQAYRLEMSTPLKNGRNKDLYQFWGETLTNTLKNEINADPDNILINLASNEYYKAIDSKKLNTRIITPTFKDFKNGSYKFLSVYGKKARGLMTRFIISNKITDPENLKLFETDGYFFDVRMSKGDNWVFTRG